MTIQEIIRELTDKCHKHTYLTEGSNYKKYHNEALSKLKALVKVCVPKEYDMEDFLGTDKTYTRLMAKNQTIQETNKNIDKLFGGE